MDFWILGLLDIMTFGENAFSSLERGFRRVTMDFRILGYYDFWKLDSLNVLAS